MTERVRVLVLILIMTMGLLLVTGITIGILYNAAFEEERARLVETAQSQARLIEAVARFDAAYYSTFPGGSGAATLKQLTDAHREYEGFGRTGEFTLARKEGDLIVFVLKHRHEEVDHPEPVPFESELAEPMRRALSGLSGTVVGLDYRGATVLAAYEPVDVLDLGIVAKIDLEEVQAPFWRAGLFSAGVSLVVLVACAILLVRVSTPLIDDLQERSYMLEASLAALSQSEERVRQVFELAGVGIAQVSLDGRFVEVNPKACAITGYSRTELRKMMVQEITHPDDLESDLEFARRLSEGEIDMYRTEKRYLRKDGSSIWTNLTISVVRDEDGGPIHFVAVIEDIRTRKEAEAALKKSLEEKEVLLREVHHRVKNNMQVISSFLSLQARKIDDPRLLALHNESQSRVRAMALIHEVLYDSEDLSSISLDEYISKLAASLMRIYGGEGKRVRLTIDVEDIDLAIDAMVPCGLVVSELISNSMRHAFPDGREGSIIIRAASTPEGGVELILCDDGVGVPADLDIRDAGSMGLGLVVNLVERQLGGRLDMDLSGGTCFSIAIPARSD